MKLSTKLLIPLGGAAAAVVVVGLALWAAVSLHKIAKR